MAAPSHAALRGEADRLLQSGLLAILERHAEVHIVGSYALGLMTWRDLDIHLVCDRPDVDAFFRLGADLARLLAPHRMHFRDESRMHTPGLPPGLYWGIYLGDERAGAWKIDLWETNREAFDAVRRAADQWSVRLTDETRAAIVDIKTACWRHPEYRRGFTSADIYGAVLDRGVREVDGFWEFLRDAKRIPRGPA
jgi:hypothetical protein